MKSWVRKSIKVGVLAAGFLLATGTSAQATDAISIDNDGVGNGNQVVVPVQAPINVCGNGIGAGLGVGVGHAQCDANAISNGGGKKNEYAESDQAPRANQPKYQPRHAAPVQENGDLVVSADNDGVLNGNQVFAPIQAPINICGNGIGALAGFGFGHAKCDATAKRESGGDVTAVTTGNDGFLNGNQVIVPIQLPVNVCGNGIGALVGFGFGQADCNATATAGKDKEKEYAAERAPEVLPLGGLTSALPLGGLSGLPLVGGMIPAGNAGDPAAAGNPLGSAGVNVNGMDAANAIAGVTGGAVAAPAGQPAENDAVAEPQPRPVGNGGGGGGGDTVISADNDGFLNGNQVFIPIQAPINVCGNGIGILGVGVGHAKCDATAER